MLRTRPSPACAQRLERGARRVERAEQVDVDHGLEAVRRQRGGGREEVAGGAVDERVELAEALDRRARPRAAIASGFRTSAATASTRAGRRRSRPPSASSTSCLRLTMHTSAPSRAYAAAMPRQMPVPPPVTSATWPASTSSRNTSRGPGIARDLLARRRARNPKPRAAPRCLDAVNRRRCMLRRSWRRRSARGCRINAGGSSCVQARGRDGRLRPRRVVICVRNPPLWSKKTIESRKSLADCTSFKQTDKGDDHGRADDPEQLQDPGRLHDDVARRVRAGVEEAARESTRDRRSSRSSRARRSSARPRRRFAATTPGRSSRSVGLRAEQGVISGVAPATASQCTSAPR